MPLRFRLHGFLHAQSFYFWRNDVIFEWQDGPFQIIQQCPSDVFFGNETRILSDTSRAHICHGYHRLCPWRKIWYVEKFQISVKNLNNLWSFIEIYAVFVLNFCGEKSLWRKNDKYKVCTLLPPAWLRLNSILAAKNSCCSLPGSETCSPYQQWENTFNLILFLLVFSKACSQLMSVFVSSPQQSYCTQAKRYESQETGRTLSGFWNRRQSSWATNYCIGR